jgi:hypothetical protein
MFRPYLAILRQLRNKEEVAQKKSDVLKQMYFNMNGENPITLEYFNLRTNGVYQ